MSQTFLAKLKTANTSEIYRCMISYKEDTSQRKKFTALFKVLFKIFNLKINCKKIFILKLTKKRRSSINLDILNSKVFSSIEVLNCIQVDDAVGATCVHGFGGAWGMIAVGLFARVQFLYQGGQINKGNK